MIGYQPHQLNPNDMLEADGIEPTIDPPTFVHPTAGLAYAQRLITPDALASALVLVEVPADVWAPACADCFRAVGTAHDCTARSGEGVTVFEAVYRPVAQVRS